MLLQYLKDFVIIQCFINFIIKISFIIIIASNFFYKVIAVVFFSVVNFSILILNYYVLFLKCSTISSKYVLYYLYPL